MPAMAAAAGVSVRTLYRMFGSREALLSELDREPPPAARARILEAALGLVGRRGLADLSMDDLAAAAGVSRATLYRLFPGKPALFRGLVESYSPWESVARVLDAARAAGDGAPERVVPHVAWALAEALAGRTGVLLRMVVEMADGDPDTADGVRRSMARGLPDLVGYLEEQMAAGRLRRVHPVLAFQLLAGPIVAHLLTRPLAALVGYDAPREDVVDEFARAWLRAMAPGAPPP